VGVLRDLTSGQERPLRAVHVIGRSPDADLALADDAVSAYHATLRFERDRWWLRDTGSTNGTRVDGRDAAPGVMIPLARGGRVEVGGGRSLLELIDDDPPVAFALGPGAAIRVGTVTSLALGASVVERVGPGAWSFSRDGATQAVRDGDRVTAARGVWWLRLPTEPTPTLARGAPPLTLTEATACFAVSRDEERVRLALRRGDEVVDVPARAHLYTLLVLARLRDGEPPGIPDPDRGWVLTEELCRMLGCTRNQLDVSIHRARRQLGELGVVDYDAIVERRPSSGKMRFGIARFVEGPIDPPPP